jgi:anti-anti-sigma factor
VEEFTVRVDRGSDPITVVIVGEFDMASVEKLVPELDGVTGMVCFDCSQLSFVDSSGLAVFAKLDRNGGAMLRHVNPHVRRVLEVVGLDRLVCES